MLIREAAKTKIMSQCLSLWWLLKQKSIVASSQRDTDFFQDIMDSKTKPFQWSRRLSLSLVHRNAVPLKSWILTIQSLNVRTTFWWWFYRQVFMKVLYKTMKRNIVPLKNKNRSQRKDISKERRTGTNMEPEGTP